MNRSPQIEKLAAALSAAQGEFEPVPKEEENPFFKSRYAGLPAVVGASHEILSKHGLSVSQLPDFDGSTDLLTTTIMHSSGQWLEASARLHPVKADPQGLGSAVTYMRRYAYAGGLGLVADDDDDGNAASRPPRTPPPPPPPPPEDQVRIDYIRDEVKRMLADIPTDGQPTAGEKRRALAAGGPQALYDMVKSRWEAWRAAEDAALRGEPGELPLRPGDEAQPIMVSCPRCSVKVPTGELAEHLGIEHEGEK